MLGRSGEQTNCILVRVIAVLAFANRLVLLLLLPVLLYVRYSRYS